MKRLATYLYLMLLAGGAAWCAACSTAETVLPQQRERMANYLRSTHSPRLVAEEEVMEEEQTPYYTTPGEGVYRYIANVYAPGRDALPEVLPASTVEITFRAYEFAFANIVTSGQRITMPYYTNDPLLRDALAALDGFNPELWRFEPLRIDMRYGDILNGLRLALIGCREGDEVECYMTYDQAYGDSYFGLIPRQSPIAIFFTVDAVTERSADL